MCNSPRILAFIGKEIIQYFIIIEQKMLCQVPKIQVTLFMMFASFYTFHLEYPKPISNVLLFLQDYIGIPDGTPWPI